MINVKSGKEETDKKETFQLFKMMLMNQARLPIQLPIG